MIKIIKVCVAFLLVAVMIFCIIPFANAAEILPLDDESVFLTQRTNYTCTLTSALMLFRRGALINGDTEWDTFTEANYAKSNWCPGGLAWTLKANGMTARSFKTSELGLKTGDLTARRIWFIDMLQKHPEGIVIYARFASSNAHAVLLTDYDESTDTFFCGDPSPAYPKKQIPLGESEMPKHVKKAGYNQYDMSSQDFVLSYITQVWIIESGIDYSSLAKITQSAEQSPEAAVESVPETTVDADDGSIADSTAPVDRFAGAKDNQIIMEVDSFNAMVFGQRVDTDSAPMIIDDRTFIPLRFFCDAIGATIEWEESLKQITVLTDDTFVTMNIGLDTAHIGESEVILDTPPFIKDSITYVPARFITQAIDAKIEWNSEFRQLIITK